MNIQSTSSISYMNQVTSIGNYNKQSVQSAFSSVQNDSDKMSFSPEGQAMSRMLRQQESAESREAHKTAFQETYAELGIENLDTENMTDEEIQEVLESFETAMEGHMNEGFKPASEMDSSELKQTISNLNDMANRMSSNEGQYGMKMGRGPGGPGGPPPGGGKGGPGKAGGENQIDSSGSDLATQLLEALEDSEDEDEDDLASQLLEALQEAEQQNLYTSNRSMAEMMAMLNPAI